ncbi:MAG: site-specific integrase [Candidatus Accumulibacter sp. UW20]|jgi:site-specific recombinase XerD
MPEAEAPQIEQRLARVDPEQKSRQPTMSLDLPLAGGPARNQSLVGPRLTAARNDHEAVATWLAKYTDNRHTLDSYRREAERLIAWAAWQGKDLPGLMVEDVLAYQAFLRDPQPVQLWCLQSEPRVLPDGAPNPLWRQLRRVKRGLADGSPNPAWRPFVSGLSAAAAKQALTILFGLFEHLAAIAYVHANPLRAAAKRSRKAPRSGQERYFDATAWATLMDWIAAMPQDSPREQAHYARTRFLFHFLYLTGLRRFEMARARTSDLRFKRGQWWLAVVGKGDLEGEVPLPADALAALQAYRASSGRPALPTPGTDQPLLMDLGGAGRPLSERAIYAIVKEVCRSAASRVAAERPDLARQIEAGSTHWLRHTAASHQIDRGVDPFIVQRNLRHASFSTTEGYIHKSRDQQHQETEKHTVNYPGLKAGACEILR